MFLLTFTRHFVPSFHRTVESQILWSHSLHLFSSDWLLKSVFTFPFFPTCLHQHWSDSLLTPICTWKSIFATPDSWSYLSWQFISSYFDLHNLTVNAIDYFCLLLFDSLLTPVLTWQWILPFPTAHFYLIWSKVYFTVIIWQLTRNPTYLTANFYLSWSDNFILLSLSVDSESYLSW